MGMAVVICMVCLLLKHSKQKPVLDLSLTTIDAKANIQVLNIKTDFLVVHKVIVVILVLE